MAYSLLAKTIKMTADTSNVTTDAINTSGADLLILGLSDYSVIAEGAISDSKSNTWSKLTVATGTGPRCTVWYCQGGTVGTNHTFTFNGAAQYPTLGVLAYSGSAASPLDQQNHNSGASVLTTGSVTPGEDNELVIAVMGTLSQGTSSSVNSGFTSQQTGVTFGAAFYLDMADLIQTTATAKNPAWTFDSGFEGAAIVATFKAAAGGGGGGKPYYAYAQQ